MTPTSCPSCSADLKGDPIPEGWRWAYAGASHFSWVEPLRDGDGRVTGYCCPVCEDAWPKYRAPPPQ